MAQKNHETSAMLAPLWGLILLAVGGVALGIWLLLSRSAPQPEGGNADAGNVTVISSGEETTAASTTTLTEMTTTAQQTTTLPEGAVTGISLSFYRASMQIGQEPMMPWVTMTPDDAEDKTEIWESSDSKVASVDNVGRITPVGAGTCTVRVTSANNPAVFAEVAVTVTDPDAPAVTTAASTTAASTTAASSAAQTVTTAAADADRTVVSATTETDANGQRTDIEVIDGVTYVQGVMIVNKTYSLPSTYNPGIEPFVQEAFDKMVAAAAQDGITLYIASGFRSYDAQVTLYNNYVARDGKEAADRYSARPGHSEHQSGLTMDVNYAGDAFNGTPEAKWLAENCWRFGFIIRFPEGKEAQTGYKYESWHVRYVGDEWAKRITDSGLCLEEYFGLESKYPD